MILTDSEVEHFDTGWGEFLGWCDTMPSEEGTYRELWGTDWFKGLYPVPRRTGVFFGGRNVNLKNSDPFAYVDELLGRSLPAPFVATLRTINRSKKPIYWQMTDIRSKVWSCHRSVLLGDAATAFLPTAGVGASTAMDAAAALADELSRASNDRLSFALKLYERRQRPRTEAAQKTRVGWQNSCSSHPERRRFYEIKRCVFTRLT